MIHNAPTPLSIALKTYPHTEGIKQGRLTDPRITLDIAEVEPIHRAFAPMAREQAFDVSEMAIVTYLQAKAYGKPLVLLPAVVAARFQQGCLIRRADQPFDVAAGGASGGTSLRGRRIGVRAYTQTTGMWIRAILSGTYGVDLQSIEWVTFEPAHLKEYNDPAWVTRAPKGADMLAMLRDGSLDAAIFGNDLPDDPTFVPVIPDPAQADRDWYGKHRYVPINHMVVMRSDIAHRQADAYRAVYALLKQAKDGVPPRADGIDRYPIGIDALYAPMREILAFCDEQQLLPHPIGVDELFAESRALLGSDM